MSPNDPEPILRPSRYLLPTRSSILAFSIQRIHYNSLATKSLQDGHIAIDAECIEVKYVT